MSWNNTGGAAMQKYLVYHYLQLEDNIRNNTAFLALFFITG